MNKPSISTVIMARNEAANIEEAIASFSFASQIMMADAGSKDNTTELAQNITTAISGNNHYDGYDLNRLTYFLGKPIRHSGWYPEYILRLFKNDKGRFSERLVHESIELDDNRSRLEGLLYHYSYRDLESYIEKLNGYSAMSAQDMLRDGQEYKFSKLLLYHPAAFVKMYIQEVGFPDGYHGLLLARLSSFHVLVKYAKFRELYKQAK